VLLHEIVDWIKPRTKAAFPFECRSPLRQPKINPPLRTRTPELFSDLFVPIPRLEESPRVDIVWREQRVVVRERRAHEFVNQSSTHCKFLWSQRGFDSILCSSGVDGQCASVGELTLKRRHWGNTSSLDWRGGWLFYSFLLWFLKRMGGK
jgi:hypothetical protein